MDLLLDADVRRPEADALVQSLRRVFNPRRLPAGITVRVAKRPVPGFEPRIAWLDIELPHGRRILMEREEKGRFSSRITNEPPPPPAQPRAVADAAAADRAGVAPAPGARPVAPEPLPPSATRITVRSGDTLMAILRRQGIDRVEADRAIQAARTLFNLRRLRIGQEITLVTGIDETGADTLKTVALRVGDDRFVKVTRTADNHFEAARVDRLGLMTASLERVRAASEQPDGEPRRERADAADRGHVMNAAFVAAAAPIASVPPGLEPQGAADPHSGAVNGVVNGTVNGAVIGALDGIAGAHLDPDDGLVRKAVVIRRGDTLSAALARAGGTREEAEAAIVAFRKVHNPRRLRVGQTLSLAFDPANGSNDAPRLASLALDVAADRDVVVTRADDGIFLSSVVDRPLERILQRTVGTIDANLYDTALAAGMPNQVLMEMVHIFSFDVDFQREIQPGDRFEVLYEAVFNTAGEFVENGPIFMPCSRLASARWSSSATSPTRGRRTTWTPRARACARPSCARRSTVLASRPATACAGTRSWATARSTWASISRRPQARQSMPEATGRSRCSAATATSANTSASDTTAPTAPAMPTSMAMRSGIKKGKRVRQGQVIAYVGSTGMSTGPHLHYEVMQGNKRINPMTLKLPSGRKLESHELAAFQQQVQKIAVLLAEVPAITRVAQR